MIISCAPQNYFKGKRPTLSQIWRWLKAILKEYMILKKNSIETDEVDREIIKLEMQYFQITDKHQLLP